MAFEIRYYKDDIEFVTEFPCFLGHPVRNYSFIVSKNKYCKQGIPDKP